VSERTQGHGAHVEVCARDAAGRGDPSYLSFREAVAQGALPFCCQGPDNGLTIDGGETLWLEVIEALAGRPADRVFVQTGGGALASACVQALADLSSAGRLAAWPRVHAVQARGAFPLARAYDRVLERVTAGGRGPGAVEGAMRFARAHRSSFMWPWESEPASVAQGILDDETYDWAAVVAGMLRSQGRPVIVSEEILREANTLAREVTGIRVSHTGTAGLAGLMEFLAGHPGARGQRMVVLFSGAAP
jgi:threonine synthase